MTGRLQEVSAREFELALVRRVEREFEAARVRRAMLAMVRRR